jgi:tetratricopeptide (TPR) repeat protein/O-antigen ligase
VTAVRFILLALHFVCPLLFFTDLTRNPYITQIALLHIGLLLAAALAVCFARDSDGLSLAFNPLDLPVGAWLAACAASWIVAYLGHAAYFREPMRAEGVRVFFFTAVNAVLAYLLAARHGVSGEAEPSAPLGGWASFCLAWGALWFFLPQARPAAPEAVWPHLWSGYGAVLWLAGLAAVFWLGRSGTLHDYWHLALSVGFLSAGYGIAQYFSHEFIWPKVLDPYGGRSVSTFGNPNFMSSYLVMLLPLAVTYYLCAAHRLHRAIYAVVILSLEAGLLCSLTRSSWVGAAAALAPLALSRRLRRSVKQDLSFHGLVACLVLGMALFWPQSNVVGYKATVLGRMTEVADIFHKGDSVYSPWYQRVLIWSCAWGMGSENPLFGKGWGLFELFYPFYQGHLLNHFEMFRTLRTHANNAHNELLEIFSQTGIVGLGVFFWTWAVFFRSSWSAALSASAPQVPAKGKGAREREPSDGENLWVLASAAGVLGMLVDNLLNVSLHFAVPAYQFWRQVGAATGLASRALPSRPVLRVRGKTAAAALGVLVGLFALAGCWQSVRVWYREVYYFVGFKYMRHSDFRRAIGALTRAYEWHPREVNNNYELGNAYARSEQLEKAAWAYREALNANAGYDEIYFNLATVLKALGRREEAIANYRTSWAINPLSHPLYVALAQTLLEGDPQRGRDLLLPVLELASEVYPEDIHFLNNLGYLYSLGREYEKAESTYARVLSLRPDMAVAERNLRTSLMQSRHAEPGVLARVGEFRKLEARLAAKVYDEETLRLARLAAQDFPRSTQARFYQASMELVRGDARLAEKMLLAVLAEEPKHVPAMINYGQMLVREGRVEEAARQYRAVLAADPDNAFAREELRKMGAQR